MKCSRFNRLLNDYIEEEVYDINLNKSMQKHINECDECRKLYNVRKNTIKSFASVINEDELCFTKRGEVMSKIDYKRYGKSINKRIGFGVRKYRLNFVTCIVILLMAVLFTPNIVNSFKGGRFIPFTMMKQIFNNNSKETNSKASFDIYLIKGENKQIYSDNESIQLEDTPIITDKDILCYHWDTHEIEVTQEFMDKHKITDKENEQLMSDGTGGKYPRISGGCSLLNTKYTDRFAVVVDGKIIYTGGFPTYAVSSVCSPQVGIDQSIINNRIKIWGNSYMINGKLIEDPRGNKKIYSTLKKLNKLEEGTTDIIKDEMSYIDKESWLDEKFNEVYSKIPLTSSNPYDYIKQDDNYKLLVAQEKVTLAYFLDKFEESSSDGLKEYCMAIICSDILGEKPEDKTWKSGREWYENYMKKQPKPNVPQDIELKLKNIIDGIRLRDADKIMDSMNITKEKANVVLSDYLEYFDNIRIIRCDVKKLRDNYDVKLYNFNGKCREFTLSRDDKGKITVKDGFYNIK